MTLEARVLVNGRVHAVRGFVYYYPECFLALDKQGYQAERVTDPGQLEFQVFVKGADWRSLPAKGIQRE
jgi:hypothetical protein